MTGGHAATMAMSVAEEIQAEKKDWEIYFIGAKWAIEGKKIPTLESVVLSKIGVTFIPLNFGKTPAQIYGLDHSLSS